MQVYYEKREDRLSAYQTVGLPHPKHFHRSMELVVVTEGVGRLDIGGEGHVLHRGDLAVIMPFVPHACLNKPGECRYGILLHQPEMLGEHLQQFTGMQLRNPVVESGRLHHDVMYAIESLIEEGNEEVSIIFDVREAFIRLVFARLAPHMSFVARSDINLSGVIGRVAEYVSNHFMEPLSLEILSRELGYSKGYLSSVFTQKLQTSFSKYVNSLRIEQAKHLLRCTDMNVLQVGLECGFENQRTFTRVFKSTSGMTPSGYRLA